MSEHDLFPVPADWAQRALVDELKYTEMYAQSVDDPEAFWGEHGKRIDWIRPYSKVKDVSYAHDDVHIRWYHDGTLNASVNCLDRHLEKRGDKTAIIWEGDDPADSKSLTYRELYEEVCKFSNVLKANGAKKGDRITIYLPMIPEIAVAVLACARIGAIHSVIFGGFSPDSIAGRIHDSDSTLIVTSDEGVRGGKPIPLKANVDEALAKCPTIEKCIVVKRTGNEIDWVDGRDVWYHEAMADAAPDCAPEEMNAEDPLFILYTSGSTGTPKGVLHTTGGYMVYASMTHQYVFDYQDSDVYWCTADVGWITGHSYIVYGPLANGATTLIFEGVPNYPDFSRFWQVCDKHQVNIFYTAPTAIRALMREGNAPVDATSRKSIRLLALKPGSATKPFFGIKPEIVDADGNVLEGAAEGNLILTDSWPGQMRTVYGDHDRFVQTYFSTYKGNYFTGDGCRRDADGYYWITGRVDDVINVSGHRMGTAEVESSLVGHSDVAEAAVVGYPHDIKGQGIYAYVTLMEGHEPSEELRSELVQWVRKDIGPIASPDLIQWAPGLPKTRSGKIMRRILRKIAANEHDQLGDTSTLADPAVVDDLVENRQNR